MSHRVLAIVFLTIATVAGLLRFNSPEFQASGLLTVIFLIATAGFLGVLLRILSLHVLQIGESIPNEHRTLSD